MTKHAPRSFASGAFVLLALLACGPARAACRVEQRGTVPVTQAGGSLLVPVDINGMQENFVLDTGAERSVVSPQAALRVGLARDEWVSTDMRGVGGRDATRLGRPRTLTIGGIALRRHTMAADNSIAVATIPDSAGGHPIAGLLGQDYLSTFDLDLDVPHGTLGLFSVSGCSGAFLPWTGRYTPIEAMRPVGNTLLLPASVDGQAFVAELDSGASSSVVIAPGIERLHLATGGSGTVRGLGAGSMAVHSQRFATVLIGGEMLPDMTMLVAPYHAWRIVDMLLGADWLRDRHVWISWATNQIFVADR